jgi:hypothetical protein
MASGGAGLRCRIAEGVPVVKVEHGVSYYSFIGLHRWLVSCNPRYEEWAAFDLSIARKAAYEEAAKGGYTHFQEIGIDDEPWDLNE